MAAPTFVGASTAVIIQTGSAAVACDVAGRAVGDVVILHVLQDGVSSLPSYTYSNIASLAGTANAMDSVLGGAEVGVGGKHHARVGRITGASPSITVTTPGDDMYCRIYVFRGVATDTTLAGIAENQGATSVTNVVQHNSGTTAAITDTAVVTTGADRLALNFVAVDDDNPLTAFTGMTGGTWAEAVAEFASATGTDGAIQLQTSGVGSFATTDHFPTATTVSNINGATGTFEQLAQSFLAPAGTLTEVRMTLTRVGTTADSGLVIEIQTDSGGLPSGTVVGTVASPLSSGLSTSAAVYTYPCSIPLAAGTYWLVARRTGARDTTNRCQWSGAIAGVYADGNAANLNSGVWTTAPATDRLFGLTQLVSAAGTIDGGSQTMAAADNWGVIGFALKPVPSGPTTHYGATSLTVGFVEVTAGKKQTYGATATPITASIAVAGNVSVPAVTHYGALAAPFAFNAATAGQRKAFGATANPYTFSKAVAGQRKTFGVTATPLTFTKAVAGSRKTFGATATPLTFAAVTAGIGTTGAVTHYGQLAALYTFAAVTQTRRRTTSSTAMPVTFAAVVQTRRRTTSSLAAPFTFGAVTASRKQYARTTTALTFSVAITATKKTYGVVARPITFGAVTAGIGYTGAATYFGATAVQLTFSKAVQGTKRTFGVVARPITFAAVVQGRRTTRTQIAAVYTWGSTTQAKRKTHAQIAMPIQWLAVTKGTATVGIQTYYGVVTRPFTFTATTVGQRRTRSTITMPITMSAFTKGMLMAAILNYATDIRWGTIQADRVMVGTTEVWTPGEDL